LNRLCTLALVRSPPPNPALSHDVLGQMFRFQRTLPRLPHPGAMLRKLFHFCRLQNIMRHVKRQDDNLVAYAALPGKRSRRLQATTPPRCWWWDKSGSPVEKPSGTLVFQNRDTLVEVQQVKAMGKVMGEVTCLSIV